MVVKTRARVSIAQIQRRRDCCLLFPVETRRRGGKSAISIPHTQNAVVAPLRRRPGVVAVLRSCSVGRHERASYHTQRGLSLSIARLGISVFPLLRFHYARLDQTLSFFTIYVPPFPLPVVAILTKLYIYIGIYIYIHHYILWVVRDNSAYLWVEYIHLRRLGQVRVGLFFKILCLHIAVDYFFLFFVMSFPFLSFSNRNNRWCLTDQPYPTYIPTACF